MHSTEQELRRHSRAAPRNTPEACFLAGYICHFYLKLSAAAAQFAVYAGRSAENAAPYSYC